MDRNDRPLSTRSGARGEIVSVYEQATDRGVQDLASEISRDMSSIAALASLQKSSR